MFCPVEPSVTLEHLSRSNNWRPYVFRENFGLGGGLRSLSAYVLSMVMNMLKRDFMTYVRPIKTITVLCCPHSTNRILRRLKEPNRCRADPRGQLGHGFHCNCSSQKLHPLMFDNNFGKCGPIKFFYQLIHKKIMYVCITKISTTPAMCCYITL